MSRSSPSRQHRYPWTDLDDEQLLDWRLCDLGLSLEGSPIEARLTQLQRELELIGLTFRAHYWISDDWFSPEGVPGFAIPFYMIHPRLMRLERSQMHQVEGGTKDWCMRILRHEVGHCIDTAYRLSRRRRWRDVFGNPGKPYPDYYQPQPHSRQYVLNLDFWYAQSHPSEDFAETFAVWMRPRFNWRQEYQDWAALQKLEYVDELMAELVVKKPYVRCRERTDSLRTIKRTLREHYAERQRQYAVGLASSCDGHLLRVFSDSPHHLRRPSAARFLRENRRELNHVVAKLTGQYSYTVDQVLTEFIERCRELKLRVHRPLGEAKRDTMVLLTIQVMNYLHEGYHKVAL